MRTSWSDGKYMVVDDRALFIAESLVSTRGLTVLKVIARTHARRSQDEGLSEVEYPIYENHCYLGTLVSRWTADGDVSIEVK